MSEIKRNLSPVFVFLLSTILLSSAAQAETTGPTFTKSFSPDEIGPESVSTLTFIIDNIGGDPVDAMAFTDTLPVGMTLAAPAFVSSNCGGSLTAPDGGSEIELSGGLLGANETCEIVVNVTADSCGEGEAVDYQNTSGDLTGNDVNTVTPFQVTGATASLGVSCDLPGFVKTFAPSTIPFGERSTLTFTIDNSANGLPVGNVDFTDNLPPGLLVADPANAVTTCVSAGAPDTTITALPGTSVVILDADGITIFPGFEVLSPGATCTVAVDVIGGAIGELGNVTNNLLADFVPVGKAAAVLEVTGAEALLDLVKEFTDDPVVPGGTATLQFTVANKSRDEAATAITFSDDLEGTLANLAPSGALPADPCGAGSSLSFSDGALTLTGGTLAPEGACTFDVQLSIPAVAEPGAYPNTAGPVSGDVGGTPETGNAAGDLLFVVDSPVLIKEFIDDPVGAGSSVTLRFTITNVNTESSLTDIAFDDDLETALPGLAANSLVSGTTDDPLFDVCGVGSKLTVLNPPDIMIGPDVFVIPPDPTMLEFTGGSLAAAGSPGDSCTFDVVLDIPAGIPDGVFVNTTGKIQGEFDGVIPEPTTGPAASGNLIVVGAPGLAKEFTDDPVAPGGSVTLEFTLSHDGSAAGDATGIAFTDDLAALVPNVSDLTVTAIVTNTCSGNVDISTPTQIAFSGGALTPGELCSFSVSVAVPGTAPTGFATNTTSEVTATVTGLAVTGNVATDDLLVTGLQFSKAFDPNTVIAGHTTTLTFTLDNSTGTSDADITSFTDNLSDALPGLVATGGATVNTCGGALSGTTFLTYVGGSVASGTTCSIAVEVLVPAATPDSTYVNTTGTLFATIGGSAVTLPPASAPLVVNSTILGLSKSFVGDPVLPDSTLDLVFTATNLSADETVTDIAFSDDLQETLSGLVATSASFNTCGGVIVEPFPTGLVTYMGGTLPPGASCTVQIAVKVPQGPLPGSVFPNTTSPITGLVDGTLNVSGNAASDDLNIQNATFSKTFINGPVVPGRKLPLRFTMRNFSDTPLSGLTFFDNLDDVLPGTLELTATDLPDNPVCGSGTVAFTSPLLTVTGASLGAAGNLDDTCWFDVIVEVPTAAEVCKSYVNITSPLSQQGAALADPATALLFVLDPLSGSYVQSDGLVSIEAENFLGSSTTGVNGPWEVLLDMFDPTDVSNRAAIKASAGADSEADGALGGALVSYSVELEAGTQDVWVRVRTISDEANSIFFKFDSDAVQTVDLGGPHNTWRWYKLPLPLLVPTPDGDVHTVTIIRREGLTEVDKLVITVDDLYDPTGLGPDESTRLSICNDNDGDGDPDITDPDDDNDGMSDEFEIANDLNPLIDDASDDPDGDGLTNLEEFEQGLDPNSPDSDGDGIGDALDEEPLAHSNFCTGGDSGNGIMQEEVTTELTCAARVSIDVISPPTVVTGDGHLTLISPLVTFETGFVAGGLTVISGDPCPSCINSVAPEVIDTNPTDFATDVPLGSNIEITFSEPVEVTGSWFDISCTVGGTSLAASVTDADPVFTLDPAVDFFPGETCDVTVYALGVTDEAIDLPLNMEADFEFSFTTVPPMDFGDAPDPTYPTLLASDGARHALPAPPELPTLFLGATVDSAQLDERDGQPSAAADGDDINGVPDDEDGVTFSTLTVSTAGTATVTASVPGLLDAWVDFNADGDWLDAGEQIATSLAVAAGPNAVPVVVPAGATVGGSFARFRLSTAGGLTPTGEAADGEVEDYLVTIVDNSPPTDITLDNISVDENQPAGTAVGTFTTTDADAGDTHTYTLVAGAGDTDNAQFQIIGDGLQTSAVLNFEAADNCVTSASTCLIRVQTDDGNGGTFQESFIIHIGDVNEAPVITSSAAQNAAENQTTVTTVTATDVDLPAQTLTFSISGGADAGKFSIVGTSGVLTFNAAPDFEIPTDLGGTAGDNIYEVQVTVTDNGAPNLTDMQDIAVTVTDVSEDVAPTVVTTTPAQGATMIMVNTSININFSEVVNATTSSFTIECPAPGNLRSFTLSSSPASSFTLDPDADLPVNTTCTVTVVAAEITDADLVDPPNNMAADFVFSFTTEAAPNQPPVGGADAYDFVGNTLLLVDKATTSGPEIIVSTTGGTTPAADGVLDNDADPDGDPVSVAGIVGCSDATAPFTDCPTTNGGKVTMEANGQFSYTPLAGDPAGSDSFEYKLSDGVAAPVNVAVTLTRKNRVWYVENDHTPNADPNDNGTSVDPFPTLAATATPSAAGDTIFVFEGDGTTAGQDAGIILKDNQRLLGEGVDLSVPDTVNGVVGPTIFDSPTNNLPKIENAGGAAVTLAVSNIVRGLDITGTNQGIVGNTFGTWTGSGLVFDTASGEAIDLTNGAVDLTIDSISSGGAGISFDTVTGTVTVTGNTEIQSGANTGVNINSSDAATFTFDNLDITTTSGHGLTANGGTINSASGSIETSSGISVDISNTVLGMTLDSVSSSSAASGIRLTNTTGSFTVTGDGTTSRNGSGGRIEASGMDGISLTNATNVSLSNIDIDGSGDNGISGSDVTGFTLRHARVTNNGNAVNEGGLRFNANLLGMATIHNSEISGSFEHNIEIINDSGTLTALNISDSDIGSNNALFGADGLLVETFGAAAATVTVSNTIFDDNRSDAIQMSALVNSTLDFTVTGSSFRSTADASSQGSVGARGMTLSAGSNATLTFDVSGANTFDTFSPALGEEAINLGLVSNSTASGSAVGTISGNTFSNSGGALGIDTRGSGILTLDFSNNIANVGMNRQVVDIITGDAAGDDPTLNLTMQNNNLGPPALSVDVVAIEFVEDSQACMNVRGNTANRTGAADGFDIFDDTNFGPTNPDIRLESGATDCGGGTCADAQTHIEDNNTILPSNDNAVDDMTLVAPGSCPTPPP